MNQIENLNLHFQNITYNWENLDRNNYHPTYFVSPKVLEKDRTQNPNDPSLWADPEDLNKLNTQEFLSYEGKIKKDSNSRPLNPHGPTGREGRGVLGKWGANFAADPIITRINKDGFLEVIVIKRKDSLKWALPGGMVDKGEHITTTLNRELQEESSVSLDFSQAIPIYQGFVNDPRNTDNAWMETDAYHLHLDKDEAKNISLKAGDDAQDAKWMVCSQGNVSSLYASHSDFIKDAILLYQQKTKNNILENGKIDIKEMEKKYPQALVIGRFQPLCNHHVAMLTEVVKTSGVKKILLCIGVSNQFDEKNFLYPNEVKQTLIPVLKKLKISYEINYIPDIHNPPKYAGYIESFFPEINEENTQLFTENSYTTDCFINYGHNYKVVKPTVLPHKATEVRSLMVNNNSEWKNLVPPHVAELINKNDCLSRLREIIKNKS